MSARRRAESKAASRPGAARKQAAPKEGHPLESGVRNQMAAQVGYDFGRLKVTPADRAGARAEGEADAAASGAGPAAAEGRGRYALDDVRIHEDRADAASMGARAYTAGRDVAFAPGEFHPDTTEGRALLAHELAHVAQAGQAPEGSAPVRRQPKGAPLPGPSTVQPGATFAPWFTDPTKRPWDVNAGIGTAAIAKVLEQGRKPVVDWLDLHFSKTMVLPVDQAVTKIFQEVPQAGDLSYEEVAGQVREWGVIHGIAIPDPPGAIKARPSLIDRIRASAESFLPDGKPSVLEEGAHVKIKITGLEASLRGKIAGPLSLKEGVNVKATLGPTGTLGFETSYQGMTFSASVGTDQWSVMLSFPGNTMEPSIAQLRRLFGGAWSALGGVREAVSGFGNLSDFDKVKTAAKPYVQKLSDAWDAFKGVAAPPPTGGVTFGIRATGPIGGSSPVPGVSVLATVTIFF